jgi:hypothetical protein
MQNIQISKHGIENEVYTMLNMKEVAFNSGISTQQY